MSTPLADLTAQLNQAVAASGSTRKDLAQLAGISQFTLRRVLEGDDLRVSTLLAIADRLDLDVALLPRNLAKSLRAPAAYPATSARPPAPVAAERPTRGIAGRAIAGLKIPATPEASP